MENNAILSEDWMGFSDRSSGSKLRQLVGWVAGWVVVYMENNAILSEEDLNGSLYSGCGLISNPISTLINLVDRKVAQQLTT